MTQRGWTDAEALQVLALRDEGKTSTESARIVGRSRASVLHKLTAIDAAATKTEAGAS